MTERELARRIPTQDDFDLFAEISGDDNPIHVDPEFCARTRFGRTVSHGMLLYSWAWGLMKTTHPTHESEAVQLMFPNPCYAGEEIAFAIEELSPGIVRIRAYRTADKAEVMVLETRLREAE